VSQVKMTRMCKQIPVTVVNGQLPGPTIEVTEGHSVTVHVVNMSPYNLTIHWHGVYQLLNCWNDGVPMVTQRPIPPNANFTYRFDVAGQEGTLWWHAHDAFLRATVYGALIIRPRNGAASYPFPKPHKEIPILIGEWWEKDLAAVDRNFTRGHYDEFSSGSTINGKLGDLFNCSGVFEDGYVLDVEPGKTYLLRVINAALFSEYFIKIAGHKFTVVAADANYVTPYATDVIVIAPGETMDALVVADAAPGTGRSCKRGDHPESMVVANMNNVSFHDADAAAPPLLEAHYYRRRRGANGGVGTAGLPDRPPSAFNYTDPALIPFGPEEMRLEPTRRATAVRRFRHGAVVDVVFQSTAMLQSDSNPMHLHGHDMFVLAQGIGNYDAATDEGKYNLVNPPRKNTVLVPNLGWAAIRFVADNP
ncbi:hypothetical protein ACJX0J_019049, partial [Zea mays]